MDACYLKEEVILDICDWFMAVTLYVPDFSKKQFGSRRP